jgi:hypothetical protein
MAAVYESRNPGEEVHLTPTGKPKAEKRPPEETFIPLVVIGLVLLALLIIVILGFVGFSDIMPRLPQPAAPQPRLG